MRCPGCLEGAGSCRQCGMERGGAWVPRRLPCPADTASGSVPESSHCGWEQPQGSKGNEHSQAMWAEELGTHGGETPLGAARAPAPRQALSGSWSSLRVGARGCPALTDLLPWTAVGSLGRQGLPPAAEKAGLSPVQPKSVLSRAACVCDPSTTVETHSARSANTTHAHLARGFGLKVNRWCLCRSWPGYLGTQ